MDDRVDKPGLFSIKGQDLPLSRTALVELMRAVLSRDHSFRFCARGWSMTPFIQDGDVITVAPIVNRLPSIGEVVAFIRPDDDRLVIHRVIDRKESSVLIQGDNGAGYPDGYIPRKDLLGRVTRIQRHGHEVRLGLGPERYVVAWLSRNLLLIPLRDRLAAILLPFLRWFKNE